MKKVIIGLVVTVAIVGVYYFTFGSKQIVTEVKKEVNREITELKNSGFYIEKKEIQADKEHFVIDFNNTKEITKYINSQLKDNNITQEDIALLKGLKVGLDVEYNPSPKDIMAIDVYPMQLPDIVYQDIQDENKKQIQTIKDMVKNRELLVHINFNKFLGFNGYIKDINRDFKLKGAKFSGDLEDDKIINLNKTIDKISYSLPNKAKFELLNLQLFMSNPMDNTFNNNTKYSIQKVTFKGDENSSTLIEFNNISGVSQDTKKDELVNSKSKFDIALLNYNIDGDKGILKNISSDIKIDNINIKALKELNNILSEDLDEKQSIDRLLPPLKKIVSSNILIDIPNISIEEITQGGNKVDGFKLKALIKTDTNFDFKQITNNPLAINNLLDAKIEIEASSQLVNWLSSNPKAMVIMMILQPIDKNGKKYYNIRFNQGSLKINGKPLM